VKWFRKAAEQNYSPAQSALGGMYKNGTGVTKDYVEACKWLNLSAAQGLEAARANRVALEKKMTPEQIAEARKLATEFKPKKP
jgi:TPR repeat protein